MENEVLSIVDKRTGKTYEIPINNGTIRAMDLRKIKTGPDDFGLMTYDPAFMNTASCQSSITFIDGDKGILRYRGYPIDQLAEKCSFLEVAYLVSERRTAHRSGIERFRHQHHLPHHAARDDQEIPGGFSLRCPSHGDVHQHRGGALHGVPGGPKCA